MNVTGASCHRAFEYLLHLVYRRKSAEILVLHVSLLFVLSRSGRGYESLRFLDPLGLVTLSTTQKLS